ncbi:CshA/CshB family fibrillar adhesin-related protein [Candidatus Glomeribacter gigasporarum]|nr:CshA/CshB family fibrillar adhesin-related protein [Candidatus Glomeribacter gigasporarum]
MNTIKSARAHARGIAQALLLGALLLLYSGSGWTQAASCYLADPAQNQNAQYQGKYLDSLCFFDMTGYDDQQASSAAGQQFSFELETGGNLSFTLKREGRPLRAATVPTFGGAPLGNMGYKGIGGKPVLYTVEHKTTSTLKFSDIRVTDRLNNPVPNFHFVAIDGESTGPIESITVKTNGGVWQVLEFIPDQSNRPDCIVLSKPEGEKSLKWNSGCVGIGMAAPVVTTSTPSEVEAVLVGGGIEGIAFALGMTGVEVKKTVLDPNNTGVGRIAPSDQFTLSITNANGNQFDKRGSATTTGAELGEQKDAQGNVLQAKAISHADTVVVSEQMAPGSRTPLEGYAPSTLTCTSSTDENNQPIHTGLPTNAPVTSATLRFDPTKFGEIFCTFTNTMPKLAAQIEVTKTADKDKVNIGETLNWTMSARNIGNIPNKGEIRLSDTLPSNVQVKAVTPDDGVNCPPVDQWTPGSQPVCTIAAGRLGVNAELKIIISAQVTAAGQATNVVTPAGEDGPKCPDNNGCTTTTQVTAPKVTVHKAVDRPQVHVGETIRWTLTVKNEGDGPTTGAVTLTDTLPEHLTDIVVEPSAPATCAAVQGRELKCAVPAGFAAGSEAKVEIRGTATQAGQYVNAVVPEGPDKPECPQGQCETTTQVARSDIQLFKTAQQKQVNIGEPIRWTITVKNSGDGATVHAYPLTDTLPEHLSDVEVKPAAPTTCAPLQGRTLTCSVPAGFAAGAETTIEVSAKPTQAGKYKNAVIGGEPTNPPVTVEIDVTGPKVQVRKTAHPAQMQIGESVVWTLSTKNEGNGATTQAITLTDTLPEHLSEIEVKPIAPTTCAPLQGRTLVCTVPAGLAAGGEAKIEIAARAQQAGTLKNLVVPGGPGGPSDPIGPGGNASCAPNECETTTEVQAPKLLAIKTANKSVAEIGDAVQYTIEVKNLGHGAVEGVRVVDQLPAGFRYIEGSALMNHTPMTEPEGKPGPQLRFQLPPIPAQAAVRYSYRVRIGVGAQQGDGTNRAQARPPYGEPSNETSAQVKVRGGVFTEEACVVGKVFVDCNHNHIQDAEELGIPGVRLYLEDGAYFITDAEGKYSYCGLSAKSHVIKIDPITLPRGSRLTTTSNRNLGDANSLFLDVKKGELIRADFAEGSCSNRVLEQVKARRAQGEVRSVENEATGEAAGPGLKFEGKAPDTPRQGTDRANQPMVKPRQDAPRESSGGSDAN